MSRRSWLPISLYVLLSSGPARATELFPGTIATQLMLKANPPCTLCHDTDAAGAGTVNQAFGRRARGYGLQPNDSQSLIVALGKMQDAQDDSDQDGTSDIDELKAGTNPNFNEITGKPAEEYAPPMYGCQTNTARRHGPPTNRGIGAAALALVLATWMRARAAERRLVTIARKNK